MKTIYSVDLPTAYGQKKISVISGDVTKLSRRIDLLTASAFARSYEPIEGTLFESLMNIGVDIYALVNSAIFDLRETSNVWLSDKISTEGVPFGRIGCIEFDYVYKEGGFTVDEQKLLGSIRSYFYMLDIATASGARIKSVAMPLLGTGSQNLSGNLMVTPLLNECAAFLKRNEQVEEVLFVERNESKAETFTNAIKASYSLLKESSAVKIQKGADAAPLVFISYTTKDRNLADNLCAKLEAKGIKAWYAPRNVEGAYAASIAAAIEKASFFVVILSRETMLSEHVLNEIDLAFQRLPNNIKFKPLRIDTADLAPAFNYYLSRQHWMDAHIPPIEKRLDEFVSSIVSEAGDI